MKPRKRAAEHSPTNDRQRSSEAPSKRRCEDSRATNTRSSPEDVVVTSSNKYYREERRQEKQQLVLGTHVSSSTHTRSLGTKRRFQPKGSKEGGSGVLARHSKPASETKNENAALVVRSFLAGNIDETCPSFQKLNLQRFVQEHQFEIKFPEKLMLMLAHVEKSLGPEHQKEADTELRKSLGNQKTTPTGGSDCVSWTVDGTAFIIKDKQRLVKDLLPLFFYQETKFVSFTRKLYRWGFRRVSSGDERLTKAAEKAMPAHDMVFAHSCFDRANRQWLPRMKSITAEGLRKEEQQQLLPAASHMQHKPKMPSVAPPVFAKAAKPLAPATTLSLCSAGVPDSNNNSNNNSCAQVLQQTMRQTALVDILRTRIPAPTTPQTPFLRNAVASGLNQATSRSLLCLSNPSTAFLHQRLGTRPDAIASPEQSLRSLLNRTLTADGVFPSSSAARGGMPIGTLTSEEIRLLALKAILDEPLFGSQQQQRQQRFVGRSEFLQPDPKQSAAVLAADQIGILKQQQQLRLAGYMDRLQHLERLKAQSGAYPL